MSNIFTDGHKAKAAKDLADATKRAHEEMVERATAKGKALTTPKPPEKGYPWPKRFYEP